MFIQQGSHLLCIFRCRTTAAANHIHTHFQHFLHIFHIITRIMKIHIPADKILLISCIRKNTDLTFFPESDFLQQFTHMCCTDSAVNSEHIYIIILGKSVHKSLEIIAIFCITHLIKYKLYRNKCLRNIIAYICRQSLCHINIRKSLKYKNINSIFIKGIDQITILFISIFFFFLTCIFYRTDRTRNIHFPARFADCLFRRRYRSLNQYPHLFPALTDPMVNAKGVCPYNISTCRNIFFMYPDNPVLMF